MRFNRHSKLKVLVLGLIFSGCASYAPSLVKLNPSGPNVRKAVSGDLTIYVEEYATAEKSERAFDTDLATEGVLPLLINVEINGQQPYEVKAMDMGIRGATLLKPLTAEETASKAGRGAVGRALGWSLIVPIISIPVAVVASAIHTSKVNEQIVRDFAAKRFPDGVFMPNKEGSGFVLPTGGGPERPCGAESRDDCEKRGYRRIPAGHHTPARSELPTKSAGQLTRGVTGVKVTRSGYTRPQTVSGSTSRKSLAYLSREGMYGFLDGRTQGFCDACFSGNYPVHFDDEGHTRQLHLFDAVQQR